MPNKFGWSKNQRYIQVRHKAFAVWIGRYNPFHFLEGRSTPEDQQINNPLGTVDENKKSMDRLVKMMIETWIELSYWNNSRFSQASEELNNASCPLESESIDKT